MKNKKVLFVATVVKKHINVFHLPYLKWFQEQGYETHVAARDDFNREECIIPYCDKHFDLPFERFPLKKNNIISYKQLKKIIDKNNYDVIHCHTPVAAMLTRIAAIGTRKKGTKVIYTAHGFHFFKGASLINWLIYLPVEWGCSFFTDVLITINKEDYFIAKKIMKAKQVSYIPGVGIDSKKSLKLDIERNNKLAELGIRENSIILLSVGELSKRKNHEVVINAIKLMNDENIHYLIAGEGNLRKVLEEKSSALGISNQIHFLGFRKDIIELCKVSDVYMFPSLQEGLPVALMEAMSVGLPVICSNVRGNTDLITSEGGRLCNPLSTIEFYRALNEICYDSTIRNEMGKKNLDVIKRFDINYIMRQMINIYNNL